MSKNQQASDTGLSINPVFGVEKIGFEHVPHDQRAMTLREVDYLWVGTNANLFFVAVGALLVSFGLSLWWAIFGCVIGNLLFAYVAASSIGSVRAGLPATTITRAAFGIRGNLPNAFFAWLSSVAFEVINTIFGVYALIALYPLLGWHDSGAVGKVLAVVVQLAIGGGVAVLGHATMVFIQRFFAVLLCVALALVLVLTFGQVNWAAAGTAHGNLASGTLFATVMTGIGVIASGPISYLYNAPDWVRYLPQRTPSRQIFSHVFWPSFLTALILCVMGAMWATLGDMSDPVGGLKPFVPTWVLIIYILAAVGGSVANNVPTYYSSGLSLQAMGLPLHRYVATALDMCVSTAIVLYVIFVQDFSTVLNDFVAVMMVWLGPYAGVWMCHGALRHWHYDPVAIHSTKDRSGAYWGWNGINLRGWLALLIGMGAAISTMVSPVYTGPISAALGGADLSWLLGFLVGGAAYWLIALTIPVRQAGLVRAMAADRSGGVRVD